MSTYELMQLFSSTGQKLDALWQFFVTVHIAIYGALFVFHKMKTHQILITLTSYFVFSIVNIRAKYYEYSLHGALLDELKARSTDGGAYLTKFIANYSIDDRIIVTIIIHLGSLLFLIYLLAKSRNDSKNT